MLSGEGQAHLSSEDRILRTSGCVLMQPLGFLAYLTRNSLQSDLPLMQAGKVGLRGLMLLWHALQQSGL